MKPRVCHQPLRRANQYRKSSPKHQGRKIYSTTTVLPKASDEIIKTVYYELELFHVFFAVLTAIEETYDLLSFLLVDLSFFFSSIPTVLVGVEK